eukprot:2052495-Amphidinium_carterae.1
MTAKKKHNVLVVKVLDQRAKLFAQARAIMTKMDHNIQTSDKKKLIQEAVREHLVEVCLRVRCLPKEELPLPKEAPKIPNNFATLESFVAFAKENAEKGDEQDR